MGLRAARDEERTLAPWRVHGRYVRTCIPYLVLALLLVATPATGQRSAQVRAVVNVPTVSQLQTDAEEATISPTGTRTGQLRIRIKANRSWKVGIVATPGDGETVWYRLADEASFHQLDPGVETVVARGDGGRTTVTLEYRWEGASETAEGLPLRPTLTAEDF